MPEIIIEAKGLKKHFVNKRDLLGRPTRVVKAVDGIDFQIREGVTLGVVGESGCGKSTLGRTLIKLLEPTGGAIRFNGSDITDFSQKEMRKIRKNMQIVFQDPYASLNPMRTVFHSVREPLDISEEGRAADRDAMTAEALVTVGISENQFDKYPHEMSGGQRQRVAIARAVITNPGFVVCDEPVSALDVSVRAQVLNLLKDLQRSKKLTYMFISHDMSVIRHISDRVMVMYLGKVVEVADKKELFANPVFPYTRALLSAIPVPDVRVKVKRVILEGEITSSGNAPAGCRLYNRCPYAEKACTEAEQVLEDIGGGHLVACHKWQKIS
jgi:oligopeptide/dipeptide ABC transporter ATP-binding protein